MKNWMLAASFLLGLLIAESGCWGQEVYQLGAVDVVHEYEGKPDGYSIRVTWASFNPAPATYDWRWLDAEVARAKAAGLKVMLRPMCGNDSPGWAIDGYLKDSRGKFPDPRAKANQDAMLAMLATLIQRYRDDVAYFHVPGFGGGSETNRPKGGFGKGFEELSDVYVARVLTMAEAVSPGNMTGGARRVIVNHARPNDDWVIHYHKMLLELDVPCVLQTNNLSAKLPTDWEGFTVVGEWRPQDKFARGFQMVGRSTATRFGGTLEEAIAKGQTQNPFYYEIYRGGDSALAAELLEPLDSDIDATEVKRLADVIRNDSYSKTLSPELYQQFVDRVAEEAKQE